MEKISQTTRTGLGPGVSHSDLTFLACVWRQKSRLDEIEYDEGCKDQRRQHRKYRSFSGVCNNLVKGRYHYGVVGLPFSRFLRAEYDGVLAKINHWKISISWSFESYSFSDGLRAIKLSKQGGNLTNAKVVINRVTQFVESTRRTNGAGAIRPVVSDIVNSFFVFFAQLVDHDVSNTTPVPVTP